MFGWQDRDCDPFTQIFFFWGKYRIQKINQCVLKRWILVLQNQTRKWKLQVSQSLEVVFSLIGTKSFSANETRKLMLCKPARHYFQSSFFIYYLFYHLFFSDILKMRKFIIFKLANMLGGGSGSRDVGSEMVLAMVVKLVLENMAVTMEVEAAFAILVAESRWRKQYGVSVNSSGRQLQMVAVMVVAPVGWCSWWW